MENAFHTAHEEIKALLTDQFATMLARVSTYPDEQISHLLKGDLIQQQALFESYLSDAINEYALQELLNTYQDTFLPDIIQQGLLDASALTEVQELHVKGQSSLAHVDERENMAYKVLEGHLQFLRQHAATIQDWCNRASSQELSSEKGQFAVAVLSSLKDIQQAVTTLSDELWLPKGSHSMESHPIEQMSIAKREGLLEYIDRIAGTDARGDLLPRMYFMSCKMSRARRSWGFLGFSPPRRRDTSHSR